MVIFISMKNAVFKCNLHVFIFGLPIVTSVISVDICSSACGVNAILCD